MRADETIEELEKYGFDAGALAKGFASTFETDISSVEVDGDTAIAIVETTMPCFGGGVADQMMDGALTKKMEGIDTTQLSEEEAMKLVMSVATEALADPKFPTTTDSFELDYVKKDGQRSLSNADEVKAPLLEKRARRLEPNLH